MLLAVLCSGCSSADSPTAPPVTTTPPASTTILSGTVTATNGGQALAAVSIDVAGQHSVTDTAGRFSLETPSGRHALMISGAGLLPRVQSVTAGSPATLDAILQSGGFDLAFYRQFVRNGFEQPAALEALRRWTTAPTFTIATTDRNTGAPIATALIQTAQDAITAVVPIWTGGKYVASFGAGGVPVEWSALLETGACAAAGVGPTNPHITLFYNQAGCNLPVTVRHETGHVLGFWHTSDRADLMFSGNSTFREPSARERYHALIAYSRPPGNRDPDTDD